MRLRSLLGWARCRCGSRRRACCHGTGVIEIEEILAESLLLTRGVRDKRYIVINRVEAILRIREIRGIFPPEELCRNAAQIKFLLVIGINREPDGQFVLRDTGRRDHRVDILRHIKLLRSPVTQRRAERVSHGLQHLNTALRVNRFLMDAGIELRARLKLAGKFHSALNLIG